MRRWFVCLVVLGLGCSASGDGRPGRDGGTSAGDGAVWGDGRIVTDCSPGSVSDCDDPVRSEVLRNADSDRDGLSDYEELCIYSTDPCNIDTDGDGITDLGEVRGTMTDPNDRSSTIPEGDFFVVLPYFGARDLRRLDFGTNITRADLYFLIDTTGSMGGPIDNVRSSLTTIAARIAERIDDVQLGVGRFDDFPFGGGGFGSGYGSAGDVPYENMQNITASIPEVQAALGRLSAAGGADGPESQVAALFHTATGLGETYRHSSSTHTIPPRNCPAIPDDPAPRIGYPCFRAGALPIIVMVTDVEMHDGPGGSNAYSGISPPPPSFDVAMAALNSIGARFVGIAVNGGGRADMEEAARRTGTVDGSSRPVVLDASGGTVSEGIIDAIGTLVGGVVQDVSTRTENVPVNPGDTDARGFIKRITPVGSIREGIPGAGISGFDETTFFQVIPGTIVTFEVDFYNDFRVPETEAAEIHRARIIVVGNGVADLDARQVYIIVPPDGSVILI
ncbi:MAG: VWA domain-containing protein [Myxococcales bacterium]|nr:VWA domain-containing protein [Myxococcales bacterium]